MLEYDDILYIKKLSHARTYCIVTLISVFINTLLCIVFETILGAFLNNNHTTRYVLICFGVLSLIDLILLLYFSITYQVGIRSEGIQSIMHSRHAYTLKQMATQYDVSLKTPIINIILLLLIPILVLTSGFSLDAKDSKANTEMEIEQSYQIYKELNQVFNHSSYTISGDSPKKRYRKSPYSYFVRMEKGNYRFTLFVQYSTDQIESVNYIADINENDSLKQNIDNFNKNMKTMNELLKKVNVKFEIEDMTTVDSLPDQFVKQYINGKRNQSIEILRLDDNKNIAVYYDARSEDELSMSIHNEIRMYIN